jgi:hypothetical protein
MSAFPTPEMSEAAPPAVATSTAAVVRQTAVVLGCFAVAGTGLFLAANQFAVAESAQHAERHSVPRVSLMRPVDGESNVPSTASFRAELFLPTVGVGADPATAAGVRLLDAQGQLVPARVTVAADGGSVTLVPKSPLKAGGTYAFQITEAFRDEAGVSFIPQSAKVTIADDGALAQVPAGVAYEQVPLPQQLPRSLYTVLALGPGTDDRDDLFAATADGRIFRYAVAEDGTLTERAVLDALPRAAGGPRMVTGLAFDPADRSRLWVSHGIAALEGADDYTGVLTVLHGDDYATATDRVVGLPRAFKDHLNFALAFDPRDARSLYLSQGSNTGIGGRDSKWNHRPERLLTAAILRIDLDRLPTDGPLDVATPVEPDSPFAGGDYDPNAADAAVTVHATGVRSGFDLLWHSSGRLFTAINGSGTGGNAPAVLDADGSVVANAPMSIGHTTDDTLADVTDAGGYHGHPNPVRREYVLMGGNPTAGIDPQEVPDYAVGVEPEAAFVLPALSLGKGRSVNGLHESRADVFDGVLRGKVFAARLSAGDDLVVLDIDSNGNARGQIVGIPGLDGLASPLDVVEDPSTGNLYVTEFDERRIMLLRPVR